MDFQGFITNKGFTAYQIAKGAGVPYSCVSDLCLNKTATKNLTLEKACKIAAYLGVDPEDLLELKLEDNTPFRYFRNTILSELKRSGKTKFLNDLMRGKRIDYYYKNEEFPKAFYLLSLFDILNDPDNANHGRYSKIRSQKLDCPFFVGGQPDMFATIIEAEQAMGRKVIPEFARHNIIEVDIYDVA